MLVKLTCRGRDFATAVRRARRAIAEFRIRGVSTNIPFLEAVLDDPDFQAGRVTTTFIEERPHLLTARQSGRPRHPAAHLPRRRHGQPAATARARRSSSRSTSCPPVDLSRAGAGRLPAAAGRARPGGLRRAAARAAGASAVTDTTFRDAHQSLLATRVRTRDLLAVAPYVARTTPQLLSLECWGGATYDVALRFLAEDPWERLAALREAMPNICLQMLLRGRNTVGYTPYPTEVTDAFVEEAAAHRDRHLPDLRRAQRRRPDAPGDRRGAGDRHGGRRGRALLHRATCPTRPRQLYTLDYYLRLAEQIVAAGAHVLAIKDMAGLLRPPAARALVTALRERFDLPVHLHTHDTAGGQLATYRRDRRPGWTPSTGRSAAHGRHHQPAVAVGDRRRDRPHRPRHRARPAGGRRPGAVLGGGAQGVRAVRVGPARARPGGSTTTRSPAGSCPTCASRPSRSAWATGSR